MRRIITFSISFILSFLSSCVYESDLSFDTDRSVAKVSVLTRSNTGEVPYLLPIHVYAFTSGGQCAGYQMLAEAEDSLSFTLPTGEYTLYALAGASADRYTLPTLENASVSSSIALINPSTGHTEIETGRADITLNTGEHEKLTLTVTRAVAQVRMSISDLPENLTDVRMSFQPLETVLRLDGSFDGEQAKLVSFPLTKKGEGEWEMEDSVFIFPSKNDATNVTIGIVLTDADGEQSYSYNATFRIEANYKYRIDAVYKTGTPDLSGVITGTDWAEELQYTFDFGEGSNSGEGDGEGEDETDPEYAPGDFYLDLYILDVEKTAGETTLTLLSAVQWDFKSFADAERLINDYFGKGLPGWSFLSEKEARMINKIGNENLNPVNLLLEEHMCSKFNNTYKFIYKDEDGEYRVFQLIGSFQTGIPPSTGTRYNLRCMKKLKLPG
ncbi:MAG: FimB/Mfa2 family fimbrial subunit [Tannerellaceae bacterium]|jgi:hypothetical protein|nr:FimB/Mfa2 family fimbrial subunit [Tannerellaceae bacterium]